MDHSWGPRHSRLSVLTSVEKVRGELTDVTQLEALMPQLHVVLHLLWIEGPPLLAANSASIYLKGHTGVGVTNQPEIRAALAEVRSQRQAQKGFGQTPHAA